MISTLLVMLLSLELVSYLVGAYRFGWDWPINAFLSVVERTYPNEHDDDEV